MDNFDDLIKSKLSNIDLDQNQDSWNLLKSKLDDIDHHDQHTHSYDAEVNKKLSSVQKNYNVEHWYSLKGRLHVIELRKNTIYSAKMIESVMFMLILMLFIKFPGLFFPIKDTPRPQLEFAEAKTNAIPETIAITSEKPLKNIHTKPNVVLTSASTAPYSYPYSKLDVVPSLALRQLQSLAVITPHSYQIKKNIEVVQDERQSLDDNTMMVETTTAMQDAMETPLESLSALPTPDVIVYSDYAMIIPMHFTTNDHKKKHGIGVWVSADINMINTPFDKVYSLASYNREALSNAVGIFYEQSRGRLSLDIGGMYAAKSYSPQQLKERYGVFDGYYFEKSLDRIHYKIGGVHTNVKYDFVSIDNWKAFFNGGLQCNLILGASYNISDELMHGDIKGRFAQSEDRLSEKSFTKGLLHGASLAESYFLTGSFGIGVAHSITKTTSLFLQAGYQRQLFSRDLGIGPNKDKIHTSSLQFGSVTYIN